MVKHLLLNERGKKRKRGRKETTKERERSQKKSINMRREITLMLIIPFPDNIGSL